MCTVHVDSDRSLLSLTPACMSVTYCARSCRVLCVLCSTGILRHADGRPCNQGGRCHDTRTALRTTHGHALSIHQQPLICLTLHIVSLFGKVNGRVGRRIMQRCTNPPIINCNLFDLCSSTLFLGKKKQFVFRPILTV